MPEELALQQVLGDGPAIDGDEGLSVAVAALMNRPCDEFLPGSRFSDDQYVDIRCRHLVDGLKDFLHPGTAADEIIELSGQFALSLQDRRSVHGDRLLARIYDHGGDIGRDPQRAASLFLRAAQAGDPESQTEMGIRYERSDGVVRDLVEAYAWLTLAERRGTGEVKRDAAQDKALLAKDMTPGDIAAAMQRVRAWKAPERPAKTAQGG